MGVELADVDGVTDDVQAMYRLDSEPTPCCVADLVYYYYYYRLAVRNCSRTTLFGYGAHSTRPGSNPKIGSTAITNGITTNYLEGGSGGQTFMLIHGSDRA